MIELPKAIIRDDTEHGKEYVLLSDASTYGDQRAAEARELMREESVPMTWQPIDTAPLTSKAVLVYCPSRKNTYTVFWDRGESEWRHFGWLSSPLLEVPSHWMPLPTPPESKG